MIQTISIPTGETKPVALVSLSLREVQILRLVRDGKGPVEIAAELNITERTARDYIFRLSRGLWVRGRIELLMWAFQNPQALELWADHRGTLHGAPARAGLKTAPPPVQQAA